MINKNRQLFDEQDYAKLDAAINTKQVIRLADVADKVTKVAFDVVRYNPDGLDKLWVVKDVDGEKVLVAMYDEDDSSGLKVEASSNPWETINDKAGNVHVFYKSEPVLKFASESFGIPKEDSYIVCENLRKSLATDKSMVHSMLKMLGRDERSAFYKAHPEIAFGDNK